MLSLDLLLKDRF